jgi:ribose transport system permease protein
MTTTSTKSSPSAARAAAVDRLQASRGARAGIRDRLQQFLAFASLIVIFLFFSAMSDNFLNYTNFTAILFSTVVIGTLALGTTFVIITGASTCRWAPAWRCAA